MPDQLDDARARLVVRPPAARLDRTAWITGLPLVALVIAEFWTLVDRRPGGTISETIWFALGGRDSAWYWVFAGMLTGLLFWMGWHFVVDPACGWRQLLVLVAGFALVGAGLWAVR